MAEQFLKPQSPIQDGEDYILPITSYDQIIMPDGISRWDGVSGSDAKVTVNSVSPDENQNIQVSISDIEGLEEAIENAGNVKTVNSKEADESGNVELTASDVGARSDEWTPAISDIEGLQTAIDNAGKTKTVNNTAPDENGNIEITAASIGALTAEDEIDAKTLEGLTLEELKAVIMAEAVYQ